MNKTAVQWLEDELKANLKHIILNQDDKMMESIFERARNKHKAQLQFAWEESSSDTTFDEFYNETFGGAGEKPGR